MDSLLAKCGRALYGPQWQTPLAQALGVADRTVRRWARGDTPTPVGVYIDLLLLTQEHAATLDDLGGQLRAKGSV